MEKTMRLSVIVPIYNAEPYLEKMLESILNQSFSDFEMILVNDGSTDNSGKICAEFAKRDQRVQVFNIENCGVSNARNYGLMKAKGQYVHFADSDDFIEDGMYEEFNIAVNHCYPDVVMCGCRQINIKKKTCLIVSNKNDQVLKNRSDIKEYLNHIKNDKHRCLLHYIWNKWYKRDILIQRNISFPLDLSLGEDFVFNCQTVQAIHSLIIISKPYYHYYIRANSLVSSFQLEPWKSRQMIFNAHRALYESYGLWDSNEKEIKMEEGKRSFAALRSVNNKRCRLSSKEKMTFLKRFSSSMQMELALYYLDNSDKKIHRLWEFLIQRCGMLGTKIVLLADHVQRLFRG